MQRVIFWMLTLFLAMFSLVAVAQIEEIDTDFRQLEPAEEQRLRAILAAPVPERALYVTLRSHFRAKDEAAVRLGDDAAREATLREQVRLVPSSTAQRNLGVTLLRRGEIEEGNAYLRDALRNAPNASQRAYSTTLLAREMYLQFSDAAARDLILSARGPIREVEAFAISNYNQTQIPSLRMVVNRCESSLAITQSLMEQRSGHYAKAVYAALEAERYARQALRDSWSTASGNIEQTYIAGDLGAALEQRVQAQIAGAQFSAAAKSIADYVRLSNELQLHPGFKANAYRLASGLRFSQREFIQAEDLVRRSGQLKESVSPVPI